MGFPTVNQMCKVHTMNPSPPTRGWIYRVLLAVVVLASVYGLVGSEEVAAWTALVAALVGNGLATANTSVDPPD